MLYWIPVQGQNYTLEIDVSDASQKEVIDEIKFKVNHLDSLSAASELDTIRNQLQLKGYIGCRLERLSGTDSSLTASYNLGPKTESISLLLADPSWSELIAPRSIGFGEVRPDGQIQLSFEELTFYLQGISDELEGQGMSFAKVYLSEIRLEEGRAQAQLNIGISRKRTIDKIVIRGYENFPKNFVRHQMGLAVGSEFSRAKLDRASLAMRGINFAEER